MNKIYEPVIGIEVHIELNTKSKMFCRCFADYFGKEPNTHTCPVCLGLPGALPYINEEAIKKCIQIGLALNCSINPSSLFERKNYFYPDLPKGYQISQLVKPLCVGGWLEVEGLDSSTSSGQVVRRIRINRVHQEEDTGKLTHVGGETLIDFNRSCVPLVEIVTEPDFHHSSEVRDYAKKLQQIFRDLGVSNADMERGDMRLEANVSVRRLNAQSGIGNSELPNYRVELKNINSFRFMVAAIEYEIKRQIAALEKGEKLTQETRGWNEDKNETYLQRSKEEAHDYRYFPEPDLPQLRTNPDDVKQIEETIKGRLSSEKVNLWESKFGISLASGATIIRQGTAELFEQAAILSQEHDVDPMGTASFIINRKQEAIKMNPLDIVNAVKGKQMVVTDEETLSTWVKEAVEENPKAAEDYQKGKEPALQVLIGAVMRKTAAKADAGKVREILQKLLK